MRRLSVIAAVAACQPAGTRWPRLETELGRELLDAVSFVQDVHPEPYRHLTREELEAGALAAALRLDGTAAPTPLEVGRAYHEALAPIRDFHLQVGLPVYQPTWRGARSLLPLQVLVTADGVYVDASVEPVAPGTRVLAIEGVPVDEIVERALPLVLADGASEAVRRGALSRHFPKYFHLAFGEAPVYRVDLALPDGAERSVAWAGVEAEELRALAAGARSRRVQGLPDEPWPVVERVDDRVTLLRLPSFGVPADAGYEARVEAAFAELGAPDLLVVDLRGNEGGLRTHGAAVLDHLLDAPYTQWRGVQTRVLAIPGRHRDRVRFLFGTEEDLRRRFDGDRPPVRFDGDPLADRFSAPGPAWAGRVAVLVDTATNSAANEMLVALAAARPDIPIVGEEPGGDCDRHPGEVPVVYRAPASEVTLLLSLLRVELVAAEGCVPGRGLAPDIPVTWTGADLAEGVDPFLRAVKALAVLEP